eukprot:403353352
MGKCLSSYRRVEHFDPKMTGTEIYDKFGNLIAGGSNRVEIQYKDKANIGYVTIGSIFGYLDERNYSIVAPYLERFFDLIDREHIERVNYEEFLPALVSFCLFSKDEMITFVFNMFDRDRDGEISKRDLFRLFTIVIDNIQVFPVNNMRAVELIQMERGDKMTKNDFVKIVQQLPYTIFPSFRLQSEMRETFGGNRFWRKCKVRLDKKEQEKKMMIEREKFFEKSKKKKEEEYQDKLEFYEAKVGEMNQAYYIRMKKMRDKMNLVRIRGRRASEGMMGVNQNLEEFREDIDKQVEKRKTIKEENPYELPVMRDRMHFSFIWDRYTLFEADNAEEMIQIDPTDNRLNLQEEIQKFLARKKTLKRIDLSFSTDSEARSDEELNNIHQRTQSNSNSIKNGPGNPQSRIKAFESDNSKSFEKILQMRKLKQQKKNSNDLTEELDKSEILRRANDLSDIRFPPKTNNNQSKQAIRRQNSDTQLLDNSQHTEESVLISEEDNDTISEEEDQGLDADELDETPADSEDEEENDRKKMMKEISRQRQLTQQRKNMLPQAIRQQSFIKQQDLDKLHKLQTLKSMKTLKSNQSKQYPVLGNKKLSNQYMGDQTLSNLERQFPMRQDSQAAMSNASPGKKFKMLRQVHNQLRPVETVQDGASTMKSKWTTGQTQNNFGQAAVVGKNKIPLNPSKRGVPQGESIATQEILNLTMSSEVSFDSKLYQQYDVQSANRSDLRNKVENRLKDKQKQIRKQKRQLQNMSNMPDPSKKSKTTIKEEQEQDNQNSSDKKSTQKRKRLNQINDKKASKLKLGKEDDDSQEEFDSEGNDEDKDDSDYYSESQVSDSNERQNQEESYYDDQDDSRIQQMNRGVKPKNTFNNNNDIYENERPKSRKPQNNLENFQNLKKQMSKANQKQIPAHSKYNNNYIDQQQTSTKKVTSNYEALKQQDQNNYGAIGKQKQLTEVGRKIVHDNQ